MKLIFGISTVLLASLKWVAVAQTLGDEQPVTDRQFVPGAYIVELPDDQV